MQLISLSALAFFAGCSASSDREIWTVVHQKRRARHTDEARSAIVRATALKDAKALVTVLQRDFGPDDKKDSKDAIWEMGRDLCKDRPDHPECARFKKQEKEEEEKAEAEQQEQQEEEVQDDTVEKQVAPAPGPAPAPAEKVAVPAPAPASVEKVEAEPLVARRKMPTGVGKPAKLPEQGFHGEDVSYRNGHNTNADWRNEYGTLPTDAEFKIQKQQAREKKAREREERERKAKEEAEHSLAASRLAGPMTILVLAVPFVSALSL